MGKKTSALVGLRSHYIPLYSVVDSLASSTFASRQHVIAFSIHVRYHMLAKYQRSNSLDYAKDWCPNH